MSPDYRGMKPSYPTHHWSVRDHILVRETSLEVNISKAFPLMDTAFPTWALSAVTEGTWRHEILSIGGGRA